MTATTTEQADARAGAGAERGGGSKQSACRPG